MPWAECGWFAAIGAVVAARVTGRPYRLVAGAVRVVANANGEAFWLGSRDHGNRWAYHAWAAAPPVAGRPGIVLDCTSRFWPLWAIRGLALWQRPEVPYVWAWDNDLPRHVSYHARHQTTRRIRRDMGQHRDRVNLAADRALAALQAGGHLP